MENETPVLPNGDAAPTEPEAVTPKPKRVRKPKAETTPAVDTAPAPATAAADTTQETTVMASKKAKTKKAGKAKPKAARKAGPAAKMVEIKRGQPKLREGSTAHKAYLWWVEQLQKQDDPKNLDRGVRKDICDRMNAKFGIKSGANYYQYFVKHFGLPK